MQGFKQWLTEGEYYTSPWGVVGATVAGSTNDGTPQDPEGSYAKKGIGSKLFGPSTHKVWRGFNKRKPAGAGLAYLPPRHGVATAAI